jgi:hypothetical protein
MGAVWLGVPNTHDHGHLAAIKKMFHWGHVGVKRHTIVYRYNGVAAEAHGGAEVIIVTILVGH